MTLYLKNVHLAQQSPNMPSEMPSCEGEKRPKIPNMINLELTKNGLFAKFSLAVIGVCGVAKNPHIFLTRANQHIQ